MIVRGLVETGSWAWFSPNVEVERVSKSSTKEGPAALSRELGRFARMSAGAARRSGGARQNASRRSPRLGISATIVLVGVADDIDTLVEEHASLTRNISEIKMPRMSNDELNEILNSRFGKLGMTITGDARWKIVTLSRGLPEFVHSLGRAAVLHALRERRLAIAEADVDAGILQILAQSDQSVNVTYKRAIDSNRKEALYRQVLLACAISKTDDEGKFAPKDVVQPLSGILGRKVDIANFQNHLGAFSSEERGGILERFGEERACKYRFRDPKMQPYVLMQGISAGVHGNDALKILSAPEQPRLSAEF